MTSLVDHQRAERQLARMERIPVCNWHIRACMIMGTATFFDAFDVLAIAYALPVLIGEWKLTLQEAGLLISAGFVGQIVGAMLFGALADRVGRLRAAVGAMSLFSLMSLLCALSWSPASLAVLRMIQGIGLGGEVPVAAAYISEIVRAKGRGRFFLLYELVFPIGLVGASLLGYWLVPQFGWRVMFIIGGGPALLAVFVQRILPESPRWLISKGRLDEAETVIKTIENAASAATGQPLAEVLMEAPSKPPAKGSWGELFRGIYLRRTFVVWGLWISTYFVSYGINTWLPTIFRTVYKMSVADALWRGVLINIVGIAGSLLCAMTVDRMGRKRWFLMAFLISAAPLLVLWRIGTPKPLELILLASASFVFVSANSMLVYLYTPEVYPTRLRTFGTGAGSAWLRVASAAGPAVVGPILAHQGVGGVFLLFGLISLAGAAVAFGITETRERRLEDVSP